MAPCLQLFPSYNWMYDGRLSRARLCGRSAVCDAVCDKGPQGIRRVSRRARAGGLQAPWHPETTWQQVRVPTSSVSIMAAQD